MLGSFGETVPQYNIKVFNEREVRAAAGIFFFFAFLAFCFAFMLSNFAMIKVVLVAFLIDFSIRLFISPRFSPSLIIARYIVRNQTVEYTGAPQKRLAWGIGWVLSVIMFFSVIVFNTSGPLNFLSCVICVLLLWLESSFGICLGCIVYGWFNKTDLQLCPGNVCEPKNRQPIQNINVGQTLTVVGFLVALVLIANTMPLNSPVMRNLTGETVSKSVEGETAAPVSEEGCEAPDWAIALGHEDMWKQHNCQ